MKIEYDKIVLDETDLETLRYVQDTDKYVTNGRWLAVKEIFNADVFKQTELHKDTPQTVNVLPLLPACGKHMEPAIQTDLAIQISKGYYGSVYIGELSGTIMLIQDQFTQLITVCKKMYPTTTVYLNDVASNLIVSTSQTQAGIKPDNILVIVMKCRYSKPAENETLASKDRYTHNIKDLAVLANIRTDKNPTQKPKLGLFDLL